ncbi:MAG: hypothetical protein IPL83_13605 [Bdellovibrionales bacterium]|nr:hypothetical protein [Bdellovibrionales bacterium]
MKAVLFSLCAIFFSMSAFAHSGHEGHLVFADGKIHAHLSWEHGPDGSGGESKMRLEWHDGATHALFEPGLPFSVSLWMPSMGHGSGPTQIQAVLNRNGEVVTGTYLVTNMYFLRMADWEIRVTMKYPDDREETQTWPIVVEGDDHGGHNH